MEKKEKTEAITAEQRKAIMDEVKHREGGVSVKDVMSKHGRTEQTYYFWKRSAEKAAAPKVATKRSKSVGNTSRKKSNPAKKVEGTLGVLMPEGRAVRIHSTDTEWAIVTFE